MKTYTSPVPGAPLRILVVDDDEAVLQIEAIVLQKEGHLVHTAKDGLSAWKALLADNYDLLLTDHTMPGVSGLALVRQVRVADMTLPVMMVSGNLDALDVGHLKSDPWSRIDAFLAKPFAVEDLVSAVNRVLGRGTSPTESDAAERI